MINIVKTIDSSSSFQKDLIRIERNNKFSTCGKCYKITPETGNGSLWIYENNELYEIIITDLHFREDTIWNYKTSKSILITFFKTISATELANPSVNLSSNSMIATAFFNKCCKLLIHKNVPVLSVTVRIKPAFYWNYLKTAYPQEPFELYEVLQNLENVKNSHEMVQIMTQLINYIGEGIAAKLFYDSKILEIFALLTNKFKQQLRLCSELLSKTDIEKMELVTSYINEHCTNTLSIESLSKLACTGTTKLKKNFKQYQGCSITEYICRQRIKLAKYLLIHSDLNICQISNEIGYSCAGRFSTLFKTYTGLLPNHYRKMYRKKI